MPDPTAPLPCPDAPTPADFMGRLAARCALTALAWAAVLLPAAAGTLVLQASDAAGQPLAGTVVFLESKEAKAASRPATGAEIVQANRQFNPAVTVVPVGTAVNFPNRDTVRHHLYSVSPVKTFEIKLYVGTPAAPVVFDQPGIAVLGCNIHDQMAAWVVVVETSHHGITGPDGRLSLAQVPAGSYRLRSWHPRLAPGAPALDQALQVPASGSVQAAVKIAGLAP
ncbi:MAG: methylamine utilization protein [Aquabacterium sp.]|nr:methylamine utilization protein [Aquabacterium sp.]